MKQNNITILQDLKDQKVNIDELVKKGFKDNQIVASDSRQNNPFLGEITYHQATYYEGLTLEIIDNEIVIVKTNQLNKDEAELFNYARDLERKVEGFGNSIWAYRFEFEDEETAKSLEYERDEYQKILDDLNDMKNKVLSKRE